MKNLCTYLLLLLTFLTVSCTSKNSTYYNYYYKPSYAFNLEKANIFIAPINIMEKNTAFSDEERSYINKYIITYVNKANFTVLPQKAFIESWIKSSDKVGGIADPSTSMFSRRRFEKCLNLAIEDLSKHYDFSYIVFPDLVIKNIKMEKNSNTGLWDGVSRQLPSRGFYRFNWKKAPAASIVMTIFGNNGKLHFLSKGGLDFMAISTRKGRVFSLEKRTNPFENRDNLAEGIKIALHPFVNYEDY
jgi:hypothetical protein